jgi:riboflavin kinase/FMN adenylyltransferase
MRHIHSLDQAGLSQPSVVTIGVFDGVHRGHQYLLGQLVDQARGRGQAPVVLTFFPYPELVLRGYRSHFYLTLPDTKAELLGAQGIELVITHPFDDTIRHIRAAAFVESLMTHLKMQSLWVGADFAMGYQREGNVDFLRREAESKGFELRVVDLMDAGGERISSTSVRNALQAGDAAEAARLLGRPFRVPGKVVAGASRGRTIGFPTANLDIPEDQAIPERGVYACWAHVDGQRIAAVTNIGLRPTFDGASALTIEAHLLDFGGDLYGHSLDLDFVAHLRNEQKFSGPQALIEQIERDIERAREILRGT